MDSIYRDGRLVTTAAVGIREGQFFLARRKEAGAQSLRWEFPGGKCDADHDERKCLVREFQEEFGVAITVGEELGSVPFSHGGRDYILVGYRVEIEREPLELREHIDSGWFFPEEVLALDLADSDRLLFESMMLSGAVP
jgi:8-oxo-dGTP diphosphatase